MTEPPYIPEDPGYENSLLQEIDSRIELSEDTAQNDRELKAVQEYQITGIPLAVCAFKYKLPLDRPRWWNEPVDLNDDTYNDRVDLLAKYKNPLCDMAHAVSDCVQFPVNTAFLHGLGVVASAMVKNFSYMRYGKEKPVGLYTVCAQPPSTGKSPANDHWSSPIIKCIGDINDANEPQRIMLQMKVENLERNIKKLKSIGEQKYTAEEIQKAKTELAKYQRYIYGVTDSTAEALEEIAAKQDGRFTIVSDEAEGVSVLFGANYGENPPNLGLVLKGWDGGYQNTGRIGRQGHSGQLIGSVAVLAQESTVKAILQAGRNASGSRGVCERFLILSEPNILHLIDYSKKKPLPHAINDAYKKFVKNIVETKGQVVFGLTPDADRYMGDILAGLRPHMADGGKFSTELMRGVIGKAEAQIMKIASVLHCGKEWWPGGSFQTNISLETMEHAAHVYVQLIKCFMIAAENEGIEGKNPEMQVASRKLKDIVNNPKKPRQAIKYADFSDSLRNTRPFSLMKGLRKHVRNSLLPNLQAHNYVVFDELENYVYINPKLRD